MADTLLILYSPDNKEQAYWASVNEQGTYSRLSHGPVSELSDAAKGHKATLLLDTSHLNITRVTIPTTNRQRQLQAIPYALEDLLADDIDELHFAAGKKQEDGHIPVITINRSLLESILNEFKNHGIFIDTLSADVLALPVKQNQWTLLIDGNRVLIKTTDFDGYYCDLDLLPLFIQALFKRLNYKPESLLIYSSEEHAKDFEQLNKLEIEINFESYNETPISIYANNLSSPKQLNILQGDYKPRRESTGYFKPWKSVAVFFIAWLGFQLISASIEISQLQKKNTELAGLIQKEFKTAHPGTNNYNNMRKRMERKLSEIRSGDNNTDKQLFLKILAEATPALSNNNKILINGIVFRNKFVDLDIQADSLQTLESIKTKLSATPGIKTVMSTSVEKDKVKGRLRLEEQS